MAHEMIIRCTDLSMELINDILDFVRDAPAKPPETVPIEEVCRQVEELSKPILEEYSVPISIQTEPGRWASPRVRTSGVFTVARS